MTRFPKVFALAAAALLTLSACAASPASGSVVSSAPARAESRGWIAVVGDSLTAVTGKHFSEGVIDSTSWLTTTMSEGYHFEGGWALAGATTDDMAASVDPIDADVVVIMAGTNDVLGKSPTSRSLANIDSIVETVGAEKVLVSAIPPMDFLPGAVPKYNRALAAHAEESGWDYIDPFADLRDGEGFVQGTSEDGIHPTPDAQVLVGRAIAAELKVLTGH